jgi:hypothetical protein
MKAKLAWVVWALVPVGIGALHMGPGQCLLKRDAAGESIKNAALAAGDGDWMAAAASYAAAREALPDEARDEKLKLAIAEAKALVEAGDFLSAAKQFEELIAQQEASDAPDEAVLKELRTELGEVAYYTAWVMRIEGATADEWKPETEKARQQFRLLSETLDGDADAESFKKNLEAAIRLEQMDLSELLALPLPKECCCKCKGLCDQKRKQRMSQCKKPGEKDAREKIKSDSAGAAKKTGSGS